MNRIKNLVGALSIAIILCPASPAKAQQGSCVAPPPGLVGWWRGETNAQDSVGSNNGTLLNGAGFASGEVGQAFNFSGNNAVQIPYSASLTLSNYTMEAWIKPLALPNNLEQQSIIFGQQYGLGSFMIRSGPAGVYAVLLFDTPSVYWQVVSSNQLSLGQFSHVVGSWDGTTLKIYVNGQLQGQSTPGATPRNPGTPFYIGGYVPNGIGTMLFNGVVDEVSLYNRGLSGAEVASIYNAGSAGKCVGPTPPPAGGEVILGPITNAANGHAYYLLSPSTWMEAEAKGVSLGGHLVTINDAAEDNWVFTNFSGFGGTNTHLWLGFTDQAQEGNFVWTSGQPVTYTHWSNGEPNNWGSGENYVYIFGPSDARAMTWNDAGPEAVDPLGVAVRGVLEIAPPVGCVAPPSGLAGWWRGEANAQDFTGNNNGTLLNGAGFASGEVGQAFNFSGNNAVEIPYSASLALSNYSMEAWIKPLALPNNGEQQSIIFGQQYGQGSILIRTGPSGVYAVLFFDTPSAYWQVVSSNQMTLGQFSHVVGSWDGTTLKIYVNGQLQGQSTPGATPSNPGTSWFMGAYVPPSGGNQYFNGLIDEVSFYNRPLSGAEVASLYNAGSAGKCTGPTAPSITQHPSNLTVASGNNASFSVVASGSSPLSYQWWSGSGAITNATGATLTLTNVQVSDSGNYYYVVVSNAVSSVTSSNALLTVTAPPPCVPPPTSLVAWWRGESSAADFVGTNPGTIVNGGGYASAMVNTGFRFTTTSNCVVIPRSAILTPANYTVEAWINPAAQISNVENQSCIFGQGRGHLQLLAQTGSTGVRIVLAFFDGSGFPSVQSTVDIPIGSFTHVAGSWDGTTLRLYINGVLNNQSTPGSVPAISPCDFFIGGFYDLSATDCSYVGQFFNGVIDEVSLYGRALTLSEIQSIHAAGSSGKCITPTPPSISIQPTNQLVASGNDAFFSVGASGSPQLVYQWWHGQTNIVGATNSTLDLTSVQAGDAGNYFVVVTNLYGSVTSSNATLTVTNQPPFITVQPQGSNVVAGSSVSFAVVAGGSKPLSYQWRLDTTNIAGATGDSYTIPAVQPGHAGTYSVVVSNQFDSVLSSNAVLTVVVLPKGMFDDFEPGIDLSLWAGFGGTVLATNYGGSVSPPNSLWFGGTGSRFATTRLLDTTSGGLIEFYLRLARGGLFPWETVDLPSEGVVLEYSVNGGAGWIGMGTYNTPAYTNWTLISLAIPDAAKAPATQFRWRQLANSGQPSDHWALDDVGVNAPAQPPRILVPPTNTTVVVGQTATFSVSAGGTTPLAYQWRSGATTITNATNALLTLTNVQIDQEGFYSVLITNVAGTTNSADVFLNVTYPPAIVRAANTTNMSGIPVTIPIILAANGDESALSFSLNFNNQQLTYAGIDLGGGASGASLLANTNQTGSGKIGVTMAVSSGTFAPGMDEVALVTFNTPILIGESSVTADVTFTNQPITGLLSDAGAQPLPVVFAGGTVTLLPSVLEGDVAPRPAGNHSLDIFDWVQVGRFVAALDSPTNSGEFQRVDCAPRVDLGDGQLKVTDWVQAGRYAALLDPVTLAGGPASPISPLGLKAGFNGKSGSREVRVSDGTAVEGVSFTLPVNLQAMGDENALGFSLLYDPMKLSYAGATKGSAATTTTLNVNTNQTVAGKVGFVLALPAGNQFAAGTRELIRVNFRPLHLAVGTNVVAFGDQPVIRSISDPTANELGASYMANSLAVNPLPELGISLNAQQAVVSWPVWAEGFELQMYGGGSLPATTWTNVSTTIQTNGNNAVVTVPLGNTSTFFRLVHP